MRQAFETTQALSHPHQWQARRIPDGQCRQGIGQIVSPRQAQFVAGQQGLELMTEKFPVVETAQTESVELGLAQPPAHYLHLIGHQRHRQGIIAVDHGRAAATENPVFGLVVGGHAAVPVQVIGADIQHGRHSESELTRSLQLKAGELQHVELALRCQQIQRRDAEIAAHARVEPRVPRHAPHQFGDGGLGVRPRDANDRRGSLAHKQVDIAQDVHPGLPGGGQQRVVQGDSRAHHEFGSLRDDIGGIEPRVYRHVRHLAAQLLQARGRCSGIHHAEGQAEAVQVPGAGQTGHAQADHHPVCAACYKVLCHGRLHPAHRNFSVASPNRTSMTVMIQKRTITRGSGHPLSS